MERTCREALGMNYDKRFGSLDMWKCIFRGFNDVFAANNITSGFFKFGLWTLDATTVCQNGIRTDSFDDTTVSVDTLSSQNRRDPVHDKLHSPPEFEAKVGFYIDTKVDIEITCDDVCKKVCTLDDTRELNRMQKEREDIRHFVDENLIRMRRCRYNHTVQLSDAERRRRRYGVLFSQPRNYNERRVAIRRILAQRECKRLRAEYYAERSKLRAVAGYWPGGTVGTVNNIKHPHVILFPIPASNWHLSRNKSFNAK